METIKDIVEELRKVAKMYLEGGNDSGSVFEMMSVYADRIEKAYKSQLTSGTMCTMECVSIGGELNQLHDAIKEMSGTIAEYRAENARLKAEREKFRQVIKDLVSNGHYDCNECSYDCGGTLHGCIFDEATRIIENNGGVK